MAPALTTRQRIWTIAQLCVAFSLLLWHLGYPFTAFYAATESQRLIYQAVMGTPQLSQPSFENKSQRNYERFLALPLVEQDFIRKHYEELQKASEKRAFSKTLDAIERLLWHLPPFEIAWLLFAVFIPLFILLRWEGAAQAAWLFPVLILCYGADGYMRGQPIQQSAEESLFPTESYLIAHYLQEPLSSSILEQQRQLQLAWKRYLIVEWAHNSPSDVAILFNQQVEAGEHAFMAARIKTLPKLSTAPRLEQPNRLVIGIYLLWNLCVAYGVSYSVAIRPLPPVS